VLADVAPAAVAKGVELELMPGLPVVIPGTPGLLAVLIRNLVDNAVRYSPSAGRVCVEALHEPGPPRLVVSDQGPGIPPAERAALGQRFHRLTGSREVGTGLGLSIVKRVAELHGGAVHFDDGPAGRGLSVVVEFPRGPGIGPEKGEARE
jgi:signal transduction histidine kinase